MKKKMNIKIDFFKNDLIDAIGAGIYEISIHKKQQSEVLYIGESVFVLVRCAGHLYNLSKAPEYFGFNNNTIQNTDVTLKFKLLEKVGKEISRKSEETRLIKEKRPLTQSGISDHMKSIEEKKLAVNTFLESDTLKAEGIDMQNLT